MKAKQIIVALLGLSSAAVWAPQAVSLIGTEEPAESEAFALDVAAFETQPPSPVAATPSRPIEQSTDTPAGTQLDQMLSALEAFSGSNPESLTKLVQTSPDWLRAGGATSAAGDGSRITGVITHDTQRIESFLNSSPLSAIVNGQDISWALFGGRIVQVGDELLNGALTVESITKGNVRFSTANGPVDIQLPPFQARPVGAAPLETFESTEPSEPTTTDRS